MAGLTMVGYGVWLNNEETRIYRRNLIDESERNINDDLEVKVAQRRTEARALEARMREDQRKHQSALRDIQNDLNEALARDSGAVNANTRTLCRNVEKRSSPALRSFQQIVGRGISSQSHIEAAFDAIEAHLREEQARDAGMRCTARTGRSAKSALMEMME